MSGVDQRPANPGKTVTPYPQLNVTFTSVHVSGKRRERSRLGRPQIASWYGVNT